MNIHDIDPDGVGVVNGAYFGLPFRPEEAEMVLISAPWDVTVSYGSGAALAPEAIVEASTQLDLYDVCAPDAWRRGIATAPVDTLLKERSDELRTEASCVIEHLESGGSANDENIVLKSTRINHACREMNDNIYRQASGWIDAGKIVGLVGGDHSTPYGLVKALSERYDSFGILHIDAHCDLRDAYEGFEFSHASIMFNILRDIPQVRRIVQVGVRDFCDAEAALAASSDRVELFDDYSLAAAEFEGTTWAQQCCRIVALLPDDVYISFDIDGLSMENCPHTGTPVTGGLSFNKAVRLIDAVVGSGRRIIGFDLVEVAPVPFDRADAIAGARILYKLCGLTLKSKSHNP